MPTDLRHDLDYLRRLLGARACVLRRPVMVGSAISIITY